jgi:hypothetical protein
MLTSFLTTITRLNDYYRQCYRARLFVFSNFEDNRDSNTKVQARGAQRRLSGMQAHLVSTQHVAHRTSTNHFLSNQTTYG